MPTARVLALTACVLLATPVFPPATAASDGCEESACWTIPLYVQAWGESLSSLSGDSMPSDTSTRGMGEWQARTVALPVDLVVPKKEAFRVVTVAAPARDESVNATIEVSAVDLLGHAVVLARSEFLPAPSPDPSDATDVANATVNRTLGPIVDGVAPTLDAITETLGVFGAEQPTSGAINATYEFLCSSPTSDQCRSARGDIGVGQRRPCTRRSALNQDMLGFLGWYAVQTYENGTLAPILPVGGLPIPPTTPLPTPIAGQRICRELDGEMGSHAANLDEAAPDAPPLWEFVPDPHGLVPPEPEPEAPLDSSWRDVTLNLSEAHPFQEEAGSVRIPSGYRLDVRVIARQRVHDARVPAPGVPRSPMELGLPMEYGRHDALTRLELRTSTPGMYATFASGREAIGPGRHTGTFSNLTDVDDFRIDVPAGVGIVVAGPGVLATLTSPDGEAVGGVAPARPTATSWSLRIERTQMPIEGLSLPATGEYAVDVALVEGGPAPPRPLPPGNVSDSLGPGNDADQFAFHAWKGQQFTLRAAPSADLGLALSVPGALVEVNASGDAFTGRAPATATFVATVARAWGLGNYQLAFEPDPAGNLTMIPLLEPQRFLPRLESPAALHGFSDGVDYKAWNFSTGGSVRHLTPWGESELGPSGWGGDLARTSAGELVHEPDRGPNVVVETSEGPIPAIPSVASFAFGPDQRLYAIKRGYPTPSIIRFAPNRTLDEYEFSQSIEPWRLLVSPNGTLFVTGGDYAATTTHRLALEEPTSETDRTGVARVYSVPMGMQGALTFDEQGRSYRMHLDTLVERFDERSGERRVVANAGTLHVKDLAFGGSQLFAILAAMGDSGSMSIGWTGVGTPGISEHHPDFPLIPPPDVAPSGFEDIIVPLGDESPWRESHILRFNVTNSGNGPLARSRFNYVPGCNFLECSAGFIEVPPIAPGETRTIEARWNTTTHFGDIEVFVQADAYDGNSWHVAESNEENNFATYRTFARIAGNHATCDRATDQAGLPRSEACRVSA